MSRIYLKSNLSVHGGVAKRFDILSYEKYAPFFKRFEPCPEPNFVFEVSSIHIV